MAIENKQSVQCDIRKRRKEDRPGEIIEAALQEFAQKGFAAARLEDVAKRAGIAKGTIYRYFDDKEGVFLACMETLATPAFDELNSFLVATQLPTRDLLKLLIHKVHSLLSEGDLPILMRIILKEGDNFPKLTEYYYEQAVGRGRKLLKLIVERGIERGELKANAATSLPIVILAPAMMAAIWKMTFNQQDAIPPEAFRNAHLDLVFDGIWQKPD